jgi:hypothetical protein
MLRSRTVRTNHDTVGITTISPSFSYIHIHSFYIHQSSMSIYSSTSQLAHTLYNGLHTVRAGCSRMKA